MVLFGCIFAGINARVRRDNHSMPPPFSVASPDFPFNLIFRLAFSGGQAASLGKVSTGFGPRSFSGGGSRRFAFGRPRNALNRPSLTIQCTPPAGSLHASVSAAQQFRSGDGPGVAL